MPAGRGSIRSWLRILAPGALAALVACGGGGRAPALEQSAAGGGAGREPRTAPDFSLPDLEGRTVHLSDYAGQVRLVDFWATWCAPCREEVPMFKDLHAQYGPRGFALLAISLDEDEEGREAVRTFVREHGIPYANLIADEKVEKAFGPIVGVPMAFLVDREGRIVETWVGAKPREVLERRIQDLLGAG